MASLYDGTEVEALARNLTATGDAARLKARLAVRKAARDVKSKAQYYAPVDTGNLRSSIHTRAEDDLTSVVSSTADYAVFQEYGTRFQPGTPHMGPALDAVEPTFIEAIAQIGDEVL